MHPARPRKGLSLIELLIVLGILLILAGIAVENYLAASIRAQVSRVHSEFRTYATAIEMYRTDHNSIPRMAHHRFYGDPDFDYINGNGVAGVVTRVLSTPIAYMTTAHLVDPFMTRREDAPLDERLYTYQVHPVYIARNPRSQFWPKALEFYGEWRLGSVGPDQSFDHRFANSAQLPYDPTNGLISLGNIWYSPRNQGIMPPVPDLLGPH